MHEGGADVEAPAHPAGVGPDRPVRCVVQPEPVEDFGRSRIDASPRELRQPADQPEVLTAGEIRIDRGELPGQADQVPDGVCIEDHVVAEHLGPAAVGSDHGRQHADRGGLAGAVRSEQAEHGPGRHVEVDAAQGHDVAEPLRQALHQDRRLAHRSRPLVGSRYSPTDAWSMSNVLLLNIQRC